MGSLGINTNITALIAQNRLSFNTQQLQDSYARLASGQRINSGADDAAGLSISEKLIAQIKGFSKASQNIQDGISALDIAEGSVQTVLNDLQRIRELAVGGASDTSGPAQRDSLAREIRVLADDIQNISSSANFNGIQLLDGTATNIIIQTGSNGNVANNTVDITPALGNVGIDADSAPAGIGLIGSAGSTVAGFTSLNDLYNTTLQTSSLTSHTAFVNFLQDVDAALQTIQSRLTVMGAARNQLENTQNNIEKASVNFSESNSKLRDLDVAKESATLAQYQVLQQASVQVLSQANFIPQSLLRLLEG